MDHRVQIVISLMKKNLRRELTLHEMSRVVNVTPSHLCRLFKAEMGGPPAKYLKQLRMLKAREMLETTSLSVKEIMNGVGILDESHFVRDFKLVYGLPPGKYRAHHNGIMLKEEVAA